MTILKSPRGLGLASALALLALSACDSSSSSEKDSGADADADVEDDGSVEDAAVEEDADVEEGGAVDGNGGDELDGGTADAGFAKISDETVKTTVSATGHDRYYAVTHDKDGNILAVGQAAATAGSGAADKGDYSILLVKYKADGEVDKAFGDQGIVQKNVVAVGNGPNAEVARGVVVQSTGKIVVAATVPHTPAGAGLLANDTDIALLRFNADGSPDNGFGSAGVKIHDLSTAHVYQPAPLADGGVPDPALSAADQQYALQLGADDELVLLGVTLGQGDKTAEPGVKRTDSDWLLTRLTADGELDTSFASPKGYVTLDIAEGGASARGVTVLKDGSLVGAGYTTVANVLDTERRQQPVLFKVKADGSFDSEFAKGDKYDTKPGVFYDFVTPGKTNAEAYGFVPQGDKFITVGYGPTNVAGSTTRDFIYARFNADGSQDKSFGTEGAAFVDFGTYDDNGRALVVLDDKRIVGVGVGRAKPETPPAAGSSVPADGAVSVLLPDGQPDTAFGTNGQKLFNIGGPADFLWGAALAPDHKSVAVVGIASAPDSTGNDDGSLLILKLQ